MKVDMLSELVVFQSEGIDQVFDNLQKHSIDSLTITPFFFDETGDKSDLRLPPLDLEGSSRELDRPLWGGDRVKYGKNRLLFKPKDEYYGNSPYRPPWVESDNDLCKQVVEEAKKRGLPINIVIPGNPTLKILDRDYPRDIHGQVQIPKISKKGCINSPNIREYYTGSVRNIIERYQPDGIFIDWIEYTNYYFSDNLVCFCDNCRAYAKELNFDFEAMKQSVEEAINWIKNLDKVPDVSLINWESIWRMMSPGMENLFEFKAKSCQRFIQDIQRIPELKNSNRTIIFPGFAPPMNQGTGFHYELLVDSSPNVLIQPKAYRFHWGMMVKWYAQELSEINGKTKPEEWLGFVKNLLELNDNHTEISDFRMPDPDEVGPITLDCEFKKMDEALIGITDLNKISFRLHGYGPVEVFKKRCTHAEKSAYKRVDIQRYGYTSENKLDHLKG
jgi:hypothetical protein